MSQPARIRPSQLAVRPDDVTDPLLWQLAFDVAAAHQPGGDGNCRNGQCVGQSGPCTAAVNARRAMGVARAATAPGLRPTPRDAVARGRAVVTAHTRGVFPGWFTRGASASSRRPCGTPRLPQRMPGAALAAA